MAGKLYGIGVGPGDPKLLTLKAKEILENVQAVAYPVKEKGEESTAYHIAAQAADLSGKQIIEIEFKMDKDRQKREACRRAAAKLLASYLDQGLDIGMITLGDVSVYSTYTYVNQMLAQKGYETEIVPGIPSFCGGAAKAQISLAEGNESFGVISSLKGETQLEAALETFDNLVVMKAGSSVKKIAAKLAAMGLESHGAVLSNVGMADEYIGPLDTDRDYGYFTTLIIKKKEDVPRMVYFIGAGPGDPQLLTIKGKKYIDRADVIIYAGSLVNEHVLDDRKPEAVVYNSAYMHLDEVIGVMKEAEAAGLMTARVHTGDPSIFGAVREQMDALDALHIPYEVIPGVSSFLGAAASLKKEYTLPGVSQTVILTRMEGRTPVPEGEKLADLAKHHATMIIFLSAGMMETLVGTLREVYPEHTPAAVVYKATWEDEKIVIGDLTNISEKVKAAGITKTALTIVGDFLGDEYELSKLYDKTFTTEFRQGQPEAENER